MELYVGMDVSLIAAPFDHDAHHRGFCPLCSGVWQHASFHYIHRLIGGQLKADRHRDDFEDRWETACNRPLEEIKMARRRFRDKHKRLSRSAL